MLSLLVAVVVAGLATTTALSAAPSNSPAVSGPALPTVATSAVHNRQAAAATRAYRSATTGDANRLVADVTRLAAAVGGSDLAAARAAELAAQGDFDQIRDVDAASPQNVATLDELSGDVPPGATFGGLHALERDLWVSGNPPADLPSVQAQVLVADYLVAKQTLAPETIVTTAVAELGWVSEQAIPGREEQYSHHDDVDIAAGVAAAQQAFGAVEPLACSVDPGGCRIAAIDLTTLAAMVAAAGRPADVPDSALTAPVQRALFETTDRTAAALSTLIAPLLPFGTAGPQPYGAAGPVT